MSKKEKLLQRFLTNPPVKDFRWEELVTMMGHLGFELHEPKGGSSHKYFVSKSDPSRDIDACRPHPNGILKSYQIREIRDQLQSWELI